MGASPEGKFVGILPAPQTKEQDAPTTDIFAFLGLPLCNLSLAANRTIEAEESQIS